MSFNFGDTDFKFPNAAYTPVSKAPADCIVDSSIYGAICDKRVSSHFFAGDSGGETTVQPLKPAPNAPMCIIMEPSRELAEQTYAQIEKFRKHLGKPEIG
jgi:ATP-dependent RNA helicase DDX1